jgi:hypothetical protein
MERLHLAQDARHLEQQSRWGFYHPYPFRSVDCDQAFWQQRELSLLRAEVTELRYQLATSAVPPPIGWR